MNSATPARLRASLPWLALAVLSLPGMGASGYLTYSHYADEATICAGVGSCELVQTSKYSIIAGVPVALMGLAYFAAVAAMSLARLARVPWALDWGTPAAFTLAVGGTAFVGYLTAVELFVLEAICPWCVSVAVMTVISLGFVLWARVAEDSDEGGLQSP